jgi:hypothetical protein
LGKKNHQKMKENKSPKNSQKSSQLLAMWKGCLRFFYFHIFEYHQNLAKYNCEQQFPLKQANFVGPNQTTIPSRANIVGPNQHEHIR